MRKNRRQRGETWFDGVIVMLFIIAAGWFMALNIQAIADNLDLNGNLLSAIHQIRDAKEYVVREPNDEIRAARLQELETAERLLQHVMVK